MAKIPCTKCGKTFEKDIKDISSIINICQECQKPKDILSSIFSDWAGKSPF